MLLTAGETLADEWFLKIDNDLNWIPVKTAGVLACRPVNPTNQASGPATFAFEIRKALDRSSPVLLQKSGLGQPISRVTLAYILTQPRATQYRFTLTDVFVSSMDQNASTNSPASVEETIQFTFDKIEMAWFELAANGGTAGGLTAWIDQTSGQAGLKPRAPFLVALTRPRGGPGVQLTWPAEAGHRYQVLTRAALNDEWTRLAESTAPADGPMNHLLPIDAPSLFMRVEEID